MIRNDRLYRGIQISVVITLIIALAGCRKEDPSPYGPGWSAVHADGLNSDYSPVQGARSLKPAWQRKFDGTINLGATTDREGRVYITTGAPGCHLYALDSRSGETLWCSEEVNRYAVASAPLIDRDGRIFLADDEAMHAFDRSGRLLWETPIKGFPLSAQFTQNGRLIFITHIGNVYVLDRTNGAALIAGENLSPGNTFDTIFDPRACMQGTEACPCANTLAFDSRSGRFIFTYWKPGTNQAALWCMQYQEGPDPSIQKVWENNSLPGGSASSPDIAADGTRVYVNDNSGNLYAISTADGTLIWKHNIGFDPGGSQSTSPGGYIMPAGANGAPLLCIRDLGDKAETLWTKQDLHNRGVATQAKGALAYVTAASPADRFSNDLIIVDVLTGKELDRDPLPGKTFFTVGTTVGPEGNVYVPTFNGLLFAFKPG